MLIGTGDPEAHAEGAPRMSKLDTDSLTLDDVEVVQVLFEISSACRDDLLPPALHPTLPGVVTWLVYDCPDSPWGPFRLAQTRIECRSGTRPRGLLLPGMIDNTVAAAALTERWGYRLLEGEIELRRGYDGADVRVRRAGEYVLALALREPVLLPPDVVQFVASLHPAHTPAGYRLVQVDPVHTISRAERCEPHVEIFDAGAWGDERVQPRSAIAAAVCRASITLPKLRFVCRPGELAFTCTESIGAG
jgi:hypothetical protein